MVSAPAAQRYVDLDLRIDPTLTGIAVRYAREYIGDWEVMIAARDLALATGGLPIPVARMVLNVARCDARWSESLPSPQRHSFTGAFPAPDGAESPEDTDDDVPVAPRATERPRRRLRVVEDKPRYRLPYDLNTTWKRRYGISGRKVGVQKRVWHLLDPERSRIRYFPHPEAVDRYHTTIYWVCGSSSIVPLLLADPPDDLPMCKSCQRLTEGPEYAEFRPELRDWWLAEQERLTAPEEKP